MMDMRDLQCGLTKDEVRRILSGDFLTEEQQRRVIASIKTPQDHALFRRAILRIAYQHGLRASE